MTAPSRERSLLTGLVGATLAPDVPEGEMLRAWLDSWSGTGHVLEAMTGLGYNARLNQSAFGWWAEFCLAQVNPLPRWIGKGFDATPWRAVQRGAIETLRREGS